MAAFLPFGEVSCATLRNAMWSTIQLIDVILCVLRYTPFKDMLVARALEQHRLRASLQ